MKVPNHEVSKSAIINFLPCLEALAADSFYNNSAHTHHTFHDFEVSQGTWYHKLKNYSFKKALQSTKLGSCQSIKIWLSSSSSFFRRASWKLPDSPIKWIKQPTRHPWLIFWCHLYANTLTNEDCRITNTVSVHGICYYLLYFCGWMPMVRKLLWYTVNRLGLGELFSKIVPFMLCSNALIMLPSSVDYAHIMLVHNIIHEHTWPSALRSRIR